MNWEIFSFAGYASIAVWGCMPLLWLVQVLWRPRRWFCHIALILGITAFVLAHINSQSHVNRIQVDRSSQIAEQLARQEQARQAAIDERKGDAAQIDFAEDDGDDRLDTAGMDEADRKYLQSFDKDATPEWKKTKKKRSAGTTDDSLESMIGATEEAEGVEADVLIEEEQVSEPILMSDEDKLAADRLDAANHMIIRVMLLLGVLVVVIDYLRRANVYREAYFPLPLPSSWLDSMTPRAPVQTRTKSPRRTLLDELRVFTRRGESFVYVTDDTDSAAQAAIIMHRLPMKRRPVEVLAVAENAAMDDDFVFETLWYGRNSFVVDSADRAEQMLARFTELLTERRASRACARQTVHVVWDTALPVSDQMRHRFANLGAATRHSLLICRDAD
ncbi:MAG: hypothetical protein HN350_18065 [Phycisphaerales bacterium]|jgi:hypothetical protein|nr:hypothetical protein [Phycisphaerales bacterium]